MYLVVGLGNPGREYENTRHNAGFMAVDEIFNRYSFSPFKAKFDGLIAEGKIGGEKVYLLKPQTFMNLSGNSVVKAAFFYKILPENVIVIHDDKDLPLGKIKAKRGGSPGGHNGLKSIDSQISVNYNRIRIGVGKPEEHHMDTVNFVLSKFSKDDMNILNKGFEFIAGSIDDLIKNGIEHYSSIVGQYK